ncbi:hypothetical protein ONZ51_g6804 [Trametes cubensis]|uniref:C2H2-type domain-containing protein n=1 Tax=Trametes cubensis TaxID=1111947 RepID=A0AAD7XAS0_9APHY|nr:hypothetical protein ONZ51_g6804 [Trametes cubensis]
MVRAQGKQTPDERKEGKKKSSSSAASASNGSAKKKPETGSWPCKMDGCKKVFAREADLKRHQRTTKTHSVPGFQCPQCDATFTRTDALRRHQKSRHNGVVIEPSEEKGKHSGDGASSGSRSPSPGGTPARSHGEGSMNGSPPAAQSSNAGSSSGPSSYYRPHTMQDGGGYYAGYPPPPRPPPPGMMMDPHYPPPPIGLPTSATRSHQSNWQPAPAAPPWGPEGHPMGPPPGMFMPSYYSPYYRHPGVPLPFPPQINPDLLAQSNGQLGGVVPPESALRNTSPDKPEGSSQGKQDAGEGHTPVSGLRDTESLRSTQSQSMNETQGDVSAHNSVEHDASTLMAAAALQAVLAFQKEQEMKEAASRRGSAAPDISTSTPPVPEAQLAEPVVTNGPPPPVASGSTHTPEAPNGPLQAISEAAAHVAPPPADTTTQPQSQQAPNGDATIAAVPTDVQVATNQPSEVAVEVKEADSSAPPQAMEQLMTEDGMPMLNPGERLLYPCGLPRTQCDEHKWLTLLRTCCRRSSAPPRPFVHIVITSGTVNSVPRVPQGIVGVPTAIMTPPPPLQSSGVWLMWRDSDVKAPRSGCLGPADDTLLTSLGLVTL